MNAQEAMKVLGLDTPPGSEEEVKAAFSEAARRAHPDSPIYDVKAAPMDKLIEARKCLLSSNFSKAFSCTICGGAGIVVRGFGRHRCVACGGTGEKR